MGDGFQKEKTPFQNTVHGLSINKSGAFVTEGVTCSTFGFFFFCWVVEKSLRPTVDRIMSFISRI